MNLHAGKPEFQPLESETDDCTAAYQVEDEHACATDVDIWKGAKKLG